MFNKCLVSLKFVKMQIISKLFFSYHVYCRVIHFIKTLKLKVMKKLAILIVSVFFVMAFSQLSAKTVKKAVLKSEITTSKNEIKSDRNEIKSEKNEIKSEKKELRKLEGNSVAEMSKINFAEDFGNVPNVNWKRSSVLDEATFNQDGKQTTAYYDSHSKLVGTTAAVTFTDLPTSAQKEIKSRYKDYTIDKVLFFEDSQANDSDMLLYGAQFEDSNNYFVELSKKQKKTILQVNEEGVVFFFAEL